MNYIVIFSYVCKFCNTVCTNILFFLNKVQSVHIWFLVDAKLRGITPSYMWYSFILLQLVLHEYDAVLFHGFVLPHKRRYHQRCLFLSNRSAIKNPLSAITLSLGSNRSKIPDNSVIALSLMLPVYKELKNDTAPRWVILIKL